MVELWQRTTAIPGGHVGDQFADGRTAYVLGGAGLGDPQGLIAVGETTLLGVGPGGLDPEGGSALGYRDVAAHERAGRVEGDAGCHRRTRRR